MKKLRINKIPQGFAPLSVRAQWVGVEILIDEAAIAKHLPQPGLVLGMLSQNKFLVMSSDAIFALREAGRDEAAKYWANHQDCAFAFSSADVELVSTELA